MSLVPANLRYFLETTRLGSIRKASDHLNIAPSAVYRSIQNLELDIGSPLFDRTSKGVTPTGAGRVLAAYTERVLAEGEHTIDRIKTLTQRSTSVSVAGPEGIAPEILSFSIDTLLADHPEVSTLFRGCSGADSLAYLESGTVDIAVHFDLQVPDTLKLFFARRLPLGVVVPPDHPLALAEQVTLDMSCEWPLILPDSSWPMRSLLSEEFIERGLSPEIRAVSSSITLMKHLVRQRHGIGIQTALGLQAEIDAGLLIHIPLAEDARFDRSLKVLVQREAAPHPIAEFLADSIRKAIRLY